MNEHLEFILESLEHCQEDDKVLKKNELDDETTISLIIMIILDI